MIHGGADTYIKPEMARELFDRAKEPKELWIVDGAKHNQALTVAPDEYRRRVLDFFLRHLPAEEETEAAKAAGNEAGVEQKTQASGPKGSSREPVAEGR